MQLQSPHEISGLMLAHSYPIQQRNAQEGTHRVLTIARLSGLGSAQSTHSTVRRSTQGAVSTCRHHAVAVAVFGPDKVSIRNVKPENTRLIPSNRPKTDSAEDGSCCQIIAPSTMPTMPPKRSQNQPVRGRI